METKICIRCTEEKEVDQFVKRGTKRGTVCSECTNKRNRERHFEKHGNKRLDRKITRESDPKDCRDCGKSKSLSEYNLVYTDKSVHRSYCKECQSEYYKKKNATPAGVATRKAYREKNKESIARKKQEHLDKPGNREKSREYARKRYHSGYKQRARANSLMLKYNITIEDYDKLLAEQDGKCKICGITPEGHGQYLAVDHCHETGTIRGLLCTKCNVSLGNFKDDAVLLAKAVDYLLKF